MLKKITEPKINMLVYIKDEHKFGIITNTGGTNIAVGSRCCAPYEVIILGFVAIKATGKNTLLKRIWNDVKSQGISLNKNWAEDGKYQYYSPFRDYWDIDEATDAGYFIASEDEIINVINQQSALQKNIPPEEAINMIGYIIPISTYGIIQNYIPAINSFVINDRSYVVEDVIVLGRKLAIDVKGDFTLIKRIHADLGIKELGYNSPNDSYAVRMRQVRSAANFQATGYTVVTNEELRSFIRNSIAKRNINKQNPIKDENRLQKQNSSVSGGSRSATARSLYTGDQITIARRHARNRAAIG